LEEQGLKGGTDKEARMSNIRVTHDTDPNNARSESNIAINPNNPMQIVAGSKKFINYQTYDFTLATAYSTDGGQTWADSSDLDINISGWHGITDPALAWDDSGNVFLVALSLKEPAPHPQSLTVGIAIYKSTDGGRTWGHPQLIHTSDHDDKQWATGDSNPASPFHGQVYAVWDDGSAMRFARTKDHGATWIGAGTGITPPGTVLVNGSFSPEINVDANGVIYIVWIAASEIKMIVSTDGGDSFHPATSPATGITTLGSATSPHFPNETFRVGTLPSACVSGQKVVVAWADRREGPSRIYYALSNDGGTSWATGPSGAPLLTGSFSADLHHFHPQIITDPDGVIGCAFYEFGPKPVTPLIDVIMAQSFDSGSSFSQFTVTDQPWDPAVDAPWAHGNPNVTFIGDYFGLDASDRGFYPLWTDTRTGIQELWTAIVPRRKCQFIINRSTLGQDEVDARRGQGGGAVIPDVFRVVVDGFSAAQIGAADPASTLNVVSPITGMTIICRGNTADLGNYGPNVQRFTFHYDVDFGPTDIAYNFPEPTKLLTLNATVATVSNSAEIELVKQPDPFILHGDPSWLSVDLRVFAVRAGEAMFGVTGVRNASDAPRFIQELISTITPTQFETLSTGEDQSKLSLLPTDGNGVPVFNFALAKVHYIGLIGAAKVRVFFRMFQAQSTFLIFDYPPGIHYRRASNNPVGQPIPLAGIQSNEYVSVPFFAEPRIDSRHQSMDRQTDDHNVRDITAHADGSEVDTFFGCWLDINQPFEQRLPIRVPLFNVDGPYNDFFNPPLSIQQAILRNLHQCLIAEIAFDPIPIPPGKDPHNWDKLAQRNIAWSDVGSAQALSTFEIRPTPIGLPKGQTADELMIDWGNLPNGSAAQIYWPAFKATEVLAMADRMYTSHRLLQIDEHTIGCHTNGITYIPIPTGGITNYAGVLSIALPDEMRKGEVFSVVVRQLTNAFSQQIPVPLITEGGGDNEDNEGDDIQPELGDMGWRRVLGAFQVTIPVKTKQVLLLTEERELSVLRWIEKTIPVDSRWHPVFGRYLELVADRVTAFGGDPDQVQPSPTGDGIPRMSRWCQRIAWLVIVILALWLALLGLTFATPFGIWIPLVGILLLALIAVWQWQCKPDLCMNIWVPLLGTAGGAGLLVLAILGGLSGLALDLVLAESGIAVFIFSLIAIIRRCPPFFLSRI
jgi:hypothetical protein